MRPDRDLALRLWNERRQDGAWKWSADQIAWRAGYASGESLKVCVTLWRRAGDKRAVRRGRRAEKTIQVAKLMKSGLSFADIEERTGIPPRNAARLASLARQMGLLPPATRGKAA